MRLEHHRRVPYGIDGYACCLLLLRLRCIDWAFHPMTSRTYSLALSFNDQLNTNPELLHLINNKIYCIKIKKFSQGKYFAIELL